MTLSKPIMVLLAEDHMVVREGLRKLLEDETDICVTGEATTGRQAVTLAKELRPDVIVMDIAMPKLNGMEATRHILQENPAARVIILSAHRDDAYVEYVMELGARGYLIKQIAGELGISIKTVEKHRDHLMQKLSIHDTAGLTRMALR